MADYIAVVGEGTNTTPAGINDFGGARIDVRFAKLDTPEQMAQAQSSRRAAGDDAVDKAVFQQEFAGLKTLGQLHADRGLDYARAGEADHRVRLGEDHVAQRQHFIQLVRLHHLLHERREGHVFGIYPDYLHPESVRANRNLRPDAAHPDHHRQVARLEPRAGAGLRVVPLRETASQMIDGIVREIRG